MDILKLIFALAFVIALMGGLAYILKRFGLVQAQIKNGKGRLKVIETIHLDARRKLAIIKRDETEHLIILGHNTETVIETDIQAVHDMGDE